MSQPERLGLDDQLRALRERADSDFSTPHEVTERGRHTVDVVELGVRVSMTRSLYPNRADGVDQYAVTISRLALDHAPAEPEVQTVLATAFGDVSGRIVERPGGPMVRMFRVAADS